MSILSDRRTWLRWTARLAGGASLGYCALYVPGHRLAEFSAEERSILPVLLLFAVLGYLVAWWREIEGGAALATIAVALGGVAFISAERDPFANSVAISLPLFLTGGLFFLSGQANIATTH